MTSILLEEFISWWTEFGNLQLIDHLGLCVIDLEENVSNLYLFYYFYTHLQIYLLLLTYQHLGLIKRT